LGEGTESWRDLLAGPHAGEPSAAGDLAIRDRAGNWTYAFCVVVDDLRHGIDLVIRGRDLLDATPAQLRLARLLAGGHPARFLHHPLLLRSDGSKLSKADGATALRSLLDGGREPGGLLAEVARQVGFERVPAALDVDGLADLFRPGPLARLGDDGIATPDVRASPVDSAPW
jgi:glutamyl/glutaminyl-tRNA synthetase